MTSPYVYDSTNHKIIPPNFGEQRGGTTKTSWKISKDIARENVKCHSHTLQKNAES
jgi:hypothetical protein